MLSRSPCPEVSSPDIRAMHPPYAQATRQAVFQTLFETPDQQTTFDPAALARLSPLLAHRVLSAETQALEAKLSHLTQAGSWSLTPALHLAALIVLRRDRATRDRLAAHAEIPLPLGGQG